ncbi:MAG: RNA methyltransferase [Treponema sp.]|jgi:TrmH RNA methyltransferase|nr:RNA methyltransferase [Treponema sp.]
MRNKLTEELAICGFNAVAAAGKLHPETINRLFLRQDRFPFFTGVCKNLAARKRPYKICEDEELERICKSSHHQGVVAMIEQPVVASLTKDDLEQWVAEGLTGLVLHAIGNDHNLGAMARSAAFFGARFIVISGADEEAQLTTSAYRVAEGGMEHAVVRRVGDTAAFLRDASRVLVTIGADPFARWRIRDFDAIAREQRARLSSRVRSGGRPAGFALVIGNEETGLPDAVKRHCSALVRIPGTGNMESLNAAHAATLFLRAAFEYRE